MTRGKNPPGPTPGQSDLLPICDPQGIAPLVAVLDLEKVLEIARLCVEDAMEKANLIAHAAEAEDWLEVAVFAHDVKSTAGQIGAARLQDLARRLEDNCKNHGANQGPELAQAFKEAAQMTQATFGVDQLPEIVALAGV